MIPVNRVPERKGISVNLTLDFDAHDLLPRLVPSTKAYGRFLSELVRSEVDRRMARAHWAETQQQAQQR